MIEESSVAFDPALLIAMGTEDPTVFWTRFSEWTADRRLFLATHTHRFVVEWCSNVLWDPDSTLIPNYFRREVTSQINRFVSRTPVGHEEPLSDHSSHPQHVAENGRLSPCITSDLIGVSNSKTVAGLGTSADFWNEIDSNLEIESLEERIALIFTPGQQTDAERGRAIKDYYQGSTLIIVGGKKDPKILYEIESVCSVAEKNVLWIESELHKSPRNLDVRLKNFTGHNSHLVFIYGRVGHDSFDHVQKAAAKARYQLIQPEHESKIVAELSFRALGSVTE